MLRPGVLSGRTIVVARATPELAAALTHGGAEVIDGAAPPAGPVHTLVVDAAPAFRAGGAGHDGLRAGLDGVWTTVRETAAERWIDGDGGGQLVVLAPAPGAGRHAPALRAGLENLVRTLATEWARHGVTTVAVLPGDRTTPAKLAALVAWLATPAGAYLTGTALRLEGDR